MIDLLFYLTDPATQRQFRPIWPKPAAPSTTGTGGWSAALVTGGTDNHLALLDVSAHGLTGRKAETALLESGIVVNRNAIPRDPNGAWYTSGIRIGTPALTTRGFGATEMDHIAEMITTVLTNTRPGLAPDGTTSKAIHAIDAGIATKVAQQAAELLTGHPLYPTVHLD